MTLQQDYALRARDYSQKKKQLRRLQEKAADRNPDEFRFAMIHSRTQNGGQRVADRGNKPLSTETVKLLKTQDAGYLTIAAQKTRNDRLKLEQAYSLSISQDASLNHRLSKGELVDSNDVRVIFVDSQGAQADYTTLSKKVRSPLSDNEEGVTEIIVARYEVDAANMARQPLLEKRRRQQQARVTRLKELECQGKEIAVAQREVSLQRARMNSTVGGITKAGVKWKIRERKR